ncbi:MAG UNVERIFIED_CONTAM: molybdopterin-dependent oxidoreductase [Thermobifida fusca]
MDDPAFRRALAFAVDVQQIVDLIYQNIVQPAHNTGLLNIWSEYFDDAVIAEHGFSYDPAEARRILAEAGYVDINDDGFVERPDGERIALTLIVPTGWTDWNEAAEVIADSAREVGIDVVTDFHCVTRFTKLDVRWRGVAASTVLKLAPPAEDATHVMVWAEYGYSANLPLDDFRRPDVILATHRDGKPLEPQHGYPVRLVVPHRYGWKSVKWVRAIEYLTADRRGFWEERGYHNLANPWLEQRYSYQEDPGDGPPLD